MGFFDQIVSAINNPNQQASPDQLGGILQAVEQLSRGQSTSPATTQTALSVVSSYVRSALQERRTHAGNDQAEQIVTRYSGTTSNPQAVQELFTPDQQQRVIQDTASRTGLSHSAIQAMLPLLVPIVLNLLQSGSSNQSSGRGTNSVLNAFLDSNRDGAVDLGDVMGLASQYLSQHRS